MLTSIISMSLGVISFMIDRKEKSIESVISNRFEKQPNRLILNEK